MQYQYSLEWARKQDEKDPLKNYREQFLFPQHGGQPKVYFTGNSLGLQPKKARKIIDQELEDWAKFGVDGHFEAKHPWYAYHEWFSEPLAQLVGTHPHEVVAMNGLTTNLHLLMVSFYRPEGKRYKIICEGKAFPSDQYALESQVRYHGYDPEDAIIEVHPREGEYALRLEDVLETIDQNAEETALMLIGGVNYYSGQWMPMEAITKAGKAKGITVGWDLAHAVGNVPLQLHDWDVDFAAWCSYKYLNSGPGSVSGVYIHERHARNKDLPRFAGWWGHDKESRFKMEKGFNPIPTAEAWQLSNAPVFAMAPHRASLELFMEVGLERLREKSIQLTGYLEFVIDHLSKSASSVEFEIITPKAINQRGCQLSILSHGKGKELFNYLTEHGVVADWREPNVIRIAPVPLYNNFEDVARFGTILEKAIA